MDQGTAAIVGWRMRNSNGMRWMRQLREYMRELRISFDRLESTTKLELNNWRAIVVVNLAILDRIQYAALRTIVGALRCTPTIKQEAEADVMPLAIRRSKHLLQYGSRVLGVGNHPVRQLILEYFPIQDVLNQTYVLPVIGRLHDEFRAISLNPVDYPAINMPAWYSTKEVPAYSTIHQHCK